MSLYVYHGPVLYYDRVIAINWHGETQADSEKKALNNLKFQFKKTSNLTPNTGGIKLLGVIEEKY
jgi:hypothetical protein